MIKFKPMEELERILSQIDSLENSFLIKSEEDLNSLIEIIHEANSDFEQTLERELAIKNMNESEYLKTVLLLDGYIIENPFLRKAADIDCEYHNRIGSDY